MGLHWKIRPTARPCRHTKKIEKIENFLEREPPSPPPSSSPRKGAGNAERFRLGKRLVGSTNTRPKKWRI